MVPEKLAGRTQWRAWSEATRSYVENLDTRLAEYLLVVEGKEEPLTIAELASAGVSEENSRQMNRYLKLRTEGAHTPPQSSKLLKRRSAILLSSGGGCLANTTPRASGRNSWSSRI